MTRPFLAACALAMGVSASWPAAAQSQDPAAAQRLFEEGRVLTARGELDAGCAKFAQSEALDPAVGTLLNLATCAQRTGATATAWHRYREAAALAVERADAIREAVARRGLEQIEKSLSRIAFVMPSRPWPAGTLVRLDGTALPAVDLSRRLPVDPGSHTIEVLAAGARPWSTSVDVGAGPVLVPVTLPDLSAGAPAPSAAPLASPSPSASSPVSPPASSADAVATPPATASGNLQTWAFIAGGTALVALGVGTFFGVRASSTWNTVTTQCPSGRCPDAATAARLSSNESDAALDATVSTVSFAVAGAAAVASVVLFLLHPREADRPVAIATDPRSGIASATLRFP